MDGSINPYKITFEDWVKTRQENINEFVRGCIDYYHLRLGQEQLLKLLSDSFECGYSAGFDDGAYINKVNYDKPIYGDGFDAGSKSS